jgi:hypothetical protein
LPAGFAARAKLHAEAKAHAAKYGDLGGAGSGSQGDVLADEVAAVRAQVPLAGGLSQFVVGGAYGHELQVSPVVGLIRPFSVGHHMGCGSFTSPMWLLHCRLFRVSW